MISVSAHGFTDVGRMRQYNEDGFGAWIDDGLFAVCDGMGGCHGGDVAMTVALEAIYEAFCTEPHPGSYRMSPPRGFERLGAAIRFANTRIFEKSQSARIYLGIGAALAAISVEGETVFIGHVGDCRVYRYRASKLERLTRDHSLVNDYLMYKPDATEEEIAAVPKNVITRALGINGEVEVALHHEHAMPDDLYLLCTDGLHCMIQDDEIARILGADSNLVEMGKTLLEATLEAGGADNIAVVLVQCSGE